MLSYEFFFKCFVCTNDSIKGGSRRAKKNCKALMMMKAAKLGWAEAGAGLGQELGRSVAWPGRAGAGQSRSRTEVRTGQEQSRSRSSAGRGEGARAEGQEQSRTEAGGWAQEQDRSRAGVRQKQGMSRITAKAG